MAIQSVEERLAAIERDLTMIKIAMKTLRPQANWISALRGTAEGNEAYAEICRLGKEMRDAELPEDSC